MMQSERNGGMFGNLLLFLSGVGVGMLIATKPGRETREQLVDLFRNTKERGQEYIRRGRHQVREGVEEARERMTGEGGKEPFYESGKYT